jgi:hypothetical protein
MSTYALSLVLLLLLAGQAVADTVELRTGQRIDGVVKQVTTDSVVVEAGGQTTTFGRDTVRAIYLEPASTLPRSPARAALDALKALQSATRSPDAFKSYQPRLSDGKAAVDRYVQAADAREEPARAAIEAALYYHTLVASALKPHLTDSEFAALGRDPALDQCAQFKEVFANTQRLNPKAFSTGDPARARGITVSMFGLGALWACASDKIAEAERLLPK